MDDQETPARKETSPSLHGVLSALTVGLIATPRSDFVLASVDMPMVEVRSRATAGPYDYIPVTDGGGGSIVGILDMRAGKVQNADGYARDHYLRLEESLLIGADAPITSFIAGLEGQPFRFVVSRASVDGLVTVSDLHKLPVRVALFAMVTEFEMTLADAINCHWPGGFQSWSPLLSEKDKAEAGRLSKGIERAIKNNVFVDELLLTSLKQKVMLSEMISSDSACDAKAIKDLRDCLTHSLKYAETYKQAAQLSVLAAGIEKRTTELRSVKVAG